MLPVVVYLCRYQDIDSFGKIKRFKESYLKHSAGFEHKLIIIRKGFENHEQEWEQLMNREIISYECRSYPDADHTLGYYRKILEDYSDRYVLFCTASCELLVDNWLLLFMKHASPNRLMAHCGSYASTQDVILHNKSVSIKCKPSFYKSNNFCTNYCPYKKANVSILTKITRKVKNKFFSILRDRTEYGKHCIENFYSFPNPFLRTSAFMVPPNLLQRIRYWPDISVVTNKSDAQLHESGKDSLSIQALKAGYELLVVGADGIAYPMEQWKESRTMSYNQENLIIGDHMNKCYSYASPEMRRRFDVMNYGEGEVDLSAFMSKISQK
jgi:hypothetical protein